MSTKNLDVQAIIERVKERTGARTEGELAEIWDYSPQNYSAKKKRGTLISDIIDWAIQEKIDLNWLVWGFGQGNVDNGTVKSGRALKEAPVRYVSEKKEMGLGRAVEIMNRIMSEAPVELRRAISEELHHLDQHLDKMAKKKNGGQTIEERIAALEQALSSATRRAKEAEAKLRRSGGT